LYALAMLAMIGALVLAFLDSHAPGLARSLGRYAKHRILRRGDTSSTYPAGAHDRLGGRPFCPCGCDANDDLPDEVMENGFEPEREMPEFRYVVRTRCRHVDEFGVRAHCHDVRTLRWWENNPFTHLALTLVRLRLSAASCPAYLRGILADHLHPVPGLVTHNVYFVASSYTNLKAASCQRQHVEAFLGAGVDVRLLHNRVDLRPGPIQLDHDYAWGIANSPATTPLRSQPALAAYALLLDGFDRNAEIAFVGFAGGTLQIAMAIRAFRTVPAYQAYLRSKVRVIAAANMIHRSVHLDFTTSLLQFDPHVDRQDPLARAFTGASYTFDDGRSFDLGIPRWRDNINVALWTKVGAEMLLHKAAARYYSVENNYFRTEPWRAPGEEEERTARHDVKVAFAPERQKVVLAPLVPEERRATERTPESAAPTITPKTAQGSAKAPKASKPGKASAG
jgi:hypothetical protein